MRLCHLNCYSLFDTCKNDFFFLQVVCCTSPRMVDNIQFIKISLNSDPVLQNTCSPSQLWSSSLWCPLFHVSFTSFWTSTLYAIILDFSENIEQNKVQDRLLHQIPSYFDSIFLTTSLPGGFSTKLCTHLTVFYTIYFLNWLWDYHTGQFGSLIKVKLYLLLLLTSYLLASYFVRDGNLIILIWFFPKSTLTVSYHLQVDFLIVCFRIFQILKWGLVDYNTISSQFIISWVHSDGWLGGYGFLVFNPSSLRFFCFPIQWPRYAKGGQWLVPRTIPTQCALWPLNYRARLPLLFFFSLSPSLSLCIPMNFLHSGLGSVWGNTPAQGHSLLVRAFSWAWILQDEKN